jgi:HSP20 family protein
MTIFPSLKNYQLMTTFTAKYIITTACGGFLMKLFDDDFEKEFEAMRQRMESMFGSPSRPGAATVCGDTGWRPSLDLYETTTDFIVLVDLAGIQPKELEVVVDSKIIRISGNRCRPTDDNLTRVHHMEIDFGHFSQAVRLPSEVDPDSASSTYRDGFLVINLPKKVGTSASVPVEISE